MFYTVLIIAIYMIPTGIGILRNHNNISAIFICNVIMGWTVLGWIISLIWSFTNNRRKEMNG